MLAAVAFHILPAVVSLYGAYVLVTGRVGGFGSRDLRGPAARAFGLVLAAALPLAVLLGPLVKIDIFPRPADPEDYAREAEIIRDIRAEYRALDEWQKANEVDLKPEQLKTVPQVDARIEAFEKYQGEYKERAARADARADELRSEQDRRERDREGRATEARQRVRGQGAVWVGIAVLLLVWAAIWLVGTKPTQAGPGGA